MERWCNEADLKWSVERDPKKGTQVRNEEMRQCSLWAAFRPAAGTGSSQRQREAAPPSAKTTHFWSPDQHAIDYLTVQDHLKVSKAPEQAGELAQVRPPSCTFGPYVVMESSMSEFWSSGPTYSNLGKRH